MSALIHRFEHMLHSYAIPWSIIRKPTYEPIDEEDPHHPMKHILRLDGTFDDTLEDRIRVASWNAFGGQQKDKFLESLGEICRWKRPHVIALQELPDLMLMDEPLVDYHRVYAPTHHVAEQGGRYEFQTCGTALLSRIPFTDSYAFPFPRTTWNYAGEDDVIVKGGTYAQLPFCDRKVGVYSVHFEAFCRPGYRRRTAEALFHEIDENFDGIEVVLGDFSAMWRGFGARWEPLLREMCDAGFRYGNSDPDTFSPRHYSGFFTGRTPSFFDYILSRGATGAEVHSERLSGSDHVATFGAINLA